MAGKKAYPASSQGCAVRSLTVEEWHELALQGTDLPVTIQLHGVSMQPLVRMDRDYVTLVPVRRALVPGDIVMFTDRPGRFCCHRVREVREDAVLTLGDNCVAPDGWIPLEQVWGLVVSVRRGERAFHVDTDAWRRWGCAWMWALPVRRVLMRARSLAGQCYHAVADRLPGRRGQGERRL